MRPITDVIQGPEFTLASRITKAVLSTEKPSLIRELERKNINSLTVEELVELAFQILSKSELFY